MSTPNAAAPANPDHLIGRWLGHFRLQRIVGRGRMGVVFLAQDEVLLRPTAVKVLSWTLSESHGQDPSRWFLSEARMAARINHPRVVQIYSVERDRAFSYIAMEYVDGMAVDRAIRQAGRFSLTRAVEILLQAATALDAAHACGVIHRDVKPANLLVGPDGNIKLTDFGMALSLTHEFPTSGVAIVGTPYYTAPEIWQHGQASAASDIYALGATFFHTVAGHPPFTSTDLSVLERQHREAAIPDARAIDPAIPERCAELVRRCLAKNPTARFASARDLAFEALELLKSLPPRPSAELPESLAPRRASTQFKPPVLCSRPPAGYASILGLARRPFSEVDPSECPYDGSPFSTALDHLSRLVDRSPGSTVALVGARSSGRSTILKRLAIAMRERRMLLFLDPRERTVPLHRLLADAAGLNPTDASSPDQELRALLSWLLRIHETAKNLSLIVVDHADDVREKQLLARLSREAAKERSFSLILSGSSSLPEELKNVDSLIHIATAELPALQLRECGDYLKAWLESCAASRLRPVLLSPDASLIVGFRCQGDLGRLHRIASNMLGLAAASNRRVVSSWDAWAATEELEWDGVVLPPAIPQPSEWPSREALATIQTCRKQAGIAARELKEIEEPD